MSSLPDSSRILVTGGSGQLGTSFRSLIPNGFFPTSAEFDLSEPATVGAGIIDSRPSAVINCAAYTKVDLAEQEESLATAVNGDSVGEMAAACASLEIPFVTFSTDYVFDGLSVDGYDEGAETCPVNAYGRSKLVGEAATAREYPESLIVRTSWVVSGTHDNFVSTMLRLGSTPGRELKVVNDQTGCPTVSDDLARASLAAMSAGAGGILHLSNPPPTTWYSFANAVFDLAGMSPDVAPCTSDEFPTPARRPENSMLLSTRAADFGVHPLPVWPESLIGVVEAQMSRLDLSS